jgi:hypothetical protein
MSSALPGISGWIDGHPPVAAAAGELERSRTSLLASSFSALQPTGAPKPRHASSAIRSASHMTLYRKSGSIDDAAPADVLRSPLGMRRRCSSENGRPPVGVAAPSGRLPQELMVWVVVVEV